MTPKAAVAYNDDGMSDQEFVRRAEAAIESLKKRLYAAEEDVDFEVEEQNGVLNVSFEDPPAKFVITPNSAAGQIWISARSKSFKLDWSEIDQNFVLEKTGESLKKLVARLMNEQLGEEVVQLG
jgi:iron donor protein CyaY